jgi:hypothetical protein
MDRQELTHQWAAQARPRRKAGNISYDGPTLYSYTTAIAHIHSNKAGERFVLMTQRRYSMTTACQKSAARSAVSHLPLVEVPHIRPAGAREHGENLDAIFAQGAEMLAKAQRAQRWHDWQSERAGALHDMAVAYTAFFKVRRKVPAFPQEAWQAARERAQRIEHPNPASLNKLERARAQRKQAEYARERLKEIDREIGKPDYSAMAERTDWRLSGAFGAGRSPGNYYGRPTGAVMLRLTGCGTPGCNAIPCDHGGEIETSMGARVPVVAAPMVWNHVQRAKARGGWLGAGRLRIGDYPLDRIDADGTLHVGCHVIPYSELAAMARALGLTS